MGEKQFLEGLEINLWLEVGGKPIKKLRAGNIKEVSLDLHYYGFSAEVEFCLAIEDDKGFHAEFAKSDFERAGTGKPSIPIVAWMSVHRAKTLEHKPEGKVLEEILKNALVVKGIVVEKEFSEALQSIPIKKEYVYLRTYKIRFVDPAAGSLSQHFPTALYFKKTMYDVLLENAPDAHPAMAEFKFQSPTKNGTKVGTTTEVEKVWGKKGDGSKLPQDYHWFLGLGSDPNNASFYDFLFWYLTKTNHSLYCELKPKNKKSKAPTDKIERVEGNYQIVAGRVEKTPIPVGFQQIGGVKVRYPRPRPADDAPVISNSYLEPTPPKAVFKLNERLLNQSGKTLPEVIEGTQSGKKKLHRGIVRRDPDPKIMKAYVDLENSRGAAIRNQPPTMSVTFKEYPEYKINCMPGTTWKIMGAAKDTPFPQFDFPKAKTDHRVIGLRLHGKAVTKVTTAVDVNYTEFHKLVYAHEPVFGEEGAGPVYYQAQDPEDCLNAEENLFLMTMEVDLEEITEGDETDAPLTLAPPFVTPSSQPVWVEGVVCSDTPDKEPKEQDETYQFMTNDLKPKNDPPWAPTDSHIRVNIPALATTNDPKKEKAIVRVNHEPGYMPGQFHFPPYAGQSVLVALSFDSARIERFLDYRTNTPGVAVDQRQGVFMGRMLRDHSSYALVEHGYRTPHFVLKADETKHGKEAKDRSSVLEIRRVDDSRVDKAKKSDVQTIEISEGQIVISTNDPELVDEKTGQMTKQPK